MAESKKFKTIAIIGAMREEITPLLEHFKDYESIEKGGNTFYKITHNSHSIIIAYSKIGKIPVPVHKSMTVSLFRSAAKELNNTASIPKQNLPGCCIICKP